MALTTYRSEACTPHQWGSFEQLWQLHIAAFVVQWLFTVSHDLNMSWHLCFYPSTHIAHTSNTCIYTHSYTCIPFIPHHTHHRGAEALREVLGDLELKLWLLVPSSRYLYSVTMVCVTWLFGHTHRHYIIVHTAPLYSMIGITSFIYVDHSFFLRTPCKCW